MQKFHGCLIDTSNGELIDAGEITVTDQGAFLVAHGQRDGSIQTSPYLPNPNRAVLAVPPINLN